MKRKFSFNRGPLKTAPKTDQVAGAAQSQSQSPEREPTPPPSTSHSHKTHASKSSICDNSPWISRRPLDAHTEQELRLACRLILQDFKPSDHGMENTDPKLDFGGLQQRKDGRSQTTQVMVRAPTGAPLELQKSTSLRRSKTRTRAKADLEIKARTQPSEAPVRANSSRKRADFAWLDERDDRREEKLKTYGKASIDIPRPAVQLNDSNEDITLPVAVASTFAHSKVSSSELPTSGRKLNRRSQEEHPAAIADAQAAEWMAKELEKKNRQDASQPQARPGTAVRPPSRSASIKENIKGYVFPGVRSRALSRAQSKESLRQPEGDQNLQRSGSWRKWAMPRRSGSRSRPGTSNGPTDDTEQAAKSESVNLNRELPPLPGLDQWKETEESKEEKTSAPKSPIAGTHIASLMRPQEQVQELSSAANRGHRKSASDTLAMQFANAHPPRASSQNAQNIPLSPHRAPPAIPDTANTMVSSWVLEQRREFASSTHTRQRSGDSDPTTASVEAATFSRKMSVDSAPRRTVTNEPKPVKKEEQKFRLKKVFTGWITRKEKKDDWTQKLEKNGVEKGVLVHDTPTASPAVRY